jgi:hypothetical protein
MNTCRRCSISRWLLDPARRPHILQERVVPIVFFSAGCVHHPQIRDLVPEAVWFQQSTDYRNVAHALHGLTARSGRRKHEREGRLRLVQ